MYITGYKREVSFQKAKWQWHQSHPKIPHYWRGITSVPHQNRQTSYERQLSKIVEGENVFLKLVRPLVKTDNRTRSDGVVGKVMINAIRPFFKDALEDVCWLCSWRLV
jgi:hypothetical protein